MTVPRPYLSVFIISVVQKISVLCANITLPVTAFNNLNRVGWFKSITSGIMSDWSRNESPAVFEWLRNKNN